MNTILLLALGAAALACIKPKYISGVGRVGAMPDKNEQLRIILSTNPMLDDYHTGIRTVQDIHTWEEVVEDVNNWITYPDWDESDIQSVDKEITIYSSYPIKKGVFVTPSRMNAEDYAEDGRVYSKRVPLSHVAWIAVDEGQYTGPVKSIGKIRTSFYDAEITTKSGNWLYEFNITDRGRIKVSEYAWTEWFLPNAKYHDHSDWLFMGSSYYDSIEKAKRGVLRSQSRNPYNIGDEIDTNELALL